MAFDNLYCVAFQMMDAQWLAKRASYMEFNVNHFSHVIILSIDINTSFFVSQMTCLCIGSDCFCLHLQDVLKSTRTQLERELALEDVSSVRDLPAFNLLKT